VKVPEQDKAVKAELAARKGFAKLNGALTKATAPEKDKVATFSHDIVKKYRGMANAEKARSLSAAARSLLPPHSATSQALAHLARNEAPREALSRGSGVHWLVTLFRNRWESSAGRNEPTTSRLTAGCFGLLSWLLTPMGDHVSTIGR